MDFRLPLLAASLALASAALATGTGPTLPEKSPENPLDTREPGQDVIDRQDEVGRQTRPPTLEAPPEVPPIEPTERPSLPEKPERRGTDASGNPEPTS